MVSPHLLEDYFSSGFEETQNPFIKEDSRLWGKYSSLLYSLFSLGLLIAAFFVSYFSQNLSNCFLIIVYFFVGTPALIDTAKDLGRLKINIEVLMTLAAFLSVLIGSQLEGALLLVLFALSHSLEHMVTQKTKGALSSLQKLAPSMAIVIDEKEESYQKSVKEIYPGTKILIRAGEVVPLDGKVLEGSSYVNLSHITGESVPIAKKIGDEVQAGSINTDGTLTVEVIKTSADSTLAKIIKLITEAGAAKPKLQRFLDRFGDIYATTIILISIAIAALMPLLFSIPYLGVEGAIYRSLAFLIAASPCALIIGAPTAYLGAISASARKGILLKGGVILDALADCTRLFFDKTGTLTTGKLSCTSVDIIGDTLDEKTLLQITAGLENGAHHPIAEAILRFAKEQKAKHHEVKEIKVIPGCGVEGFVTLKDKQEKAFVGSPDYILEKTPQELKKQVEERISRDGHVVACTLVNDSIAIFHFEDEVRQDGKEILQNLTKHIEIEMLTGDHKDNAKNVADQLGISSFHSDVTPDGKLDIVKKASEKEHIIMVGDGINDAPALTFAYVGIAMGGVGSHTAVEASDAVLLNDDISTIGWLLRHAKRTHKIVKQNIAFALAAIAVNAILSLAGIFPLFIAVIMHEGSTVLVGLNSLRLLRGGAQRSKSLRNL
ncbi:cation-translocating P-type ATPase [bacterium]|nr:cation-translocating P-type ATPase [bacterium]